MLARGVLCLMFHFRDEDAERNSKRKKKKRDLYTIM